MFSKKASQSRLRPDLQRAFDHCHTTSRLFGAQDWLILIDQISLELLLMCQWVLDELKSELLGASFLVNLTGWQLKPFQIDLIEQWGIPFPHYRYCAVGLIPAPPFFFDLQKRVQTLGRRQTCESYKSEGPVQAARGENDP